MNRRLVPAALAGVAALLLATTSVAQADPTSTPGNPPAGKAADQIWSTVGADAFAELTNNITVKYNAQTPSPARTLASYDAVNPSNGAAGEQITTKPGCSIARPNGANAGVSAITLNQTSSTVPSEYCIDWVRSSRSKTLTGTAAPAEANLTFYAQSRDAVSYATVGNAYAPTGFLTKDQLKDIFECTTKDWSQVGGQPGAIHVYLPPASAATLTFFLQAIGSNLTDVNKGCGNTGAPGGPTLSQQNDGRTLAGDPQGITPYAVTKWAAQSNEPAGISDLRGGSTIGRVTTTTAPTTTETLNGVQYEVLNPAFTATTTGSPTFGRLFFNVVRNDAPQGLKDIFKAGGYLCTNQEAFLVPFGNTPLDRPGSDRPCGQVS